MAFQVSNSHLFYEKQAFISIDFKSSKSLLPNKISTVRPIRSSSVSVITPIVSDTTTSTIPSGSRFTWDDVFRHSDNHNQQRSSDLSGFFDKIHFCNRGSDLQSEFLEFIIEDQVVGYVHYRLADQLRRFSDVFVVFRRGNSDYLTLHKRLETAEDRTRSIARVIRCLGDENVIPGIRNEMYPVASSFGSRPYFLLERAAAPYFGIKAYEIHMNGYVERDGEKYLWIGKRSGMKATYPGMLDHIAAGGQPYGISCGENIVKECQEEAGVHFSLSQRAIPVGAVSYIEIGEFKYRRDVVFSYDLELPDGFIPENRDGEVESFKLIPVKTVANIVRNTHFFKPNCSLVIIDFLFRHGYITPECLGYLDLLGSLKNGECS
ncbi:hypothetical protein M5689_015954 [Euphorbia peplus]|nr:hypothetical protein M5689_015954 [Euphorbia peplus]